MPVTPNKTRLTMIRGATSYPLNDGTVLFTTPDGPVTLYYIADTGLGMAGITRFSERGPAQHGDTDLGFILEPRVISYIFGILTPNTDGTKYLDAARLLILSMFRPAQDPVSFRYDRADGTTLQIDGHFTGGLQLGSTERDPGTWFQRVSVDFKMSNPTWYNPTLQTVTLTNAAWTGGMPISLPVAFPVGEGAFSVTTNIVYPGSWETYPNLRITGPLHNFVIRNTTLGLVLPFVGDVEMNAYWDITLTGSLKTVVDSLGFSQLPALQDPNNLDNFRLGAAPDVAGGTNTITIVGTGANGMTKVDIMYTPRYIGI